MHPGLVDKLSLAMKQAKYSPQVWKDHTGKTVEELWAQCVAGTK